MLEQLRERLSDLRNGAAEDEPDEPLRLDSLRLLAAEMLLVTGIGATMDVLTRAREAQKDRIPGIRMRSDLPLAAIWGPALVAPVAAAAHLRLARGPAPDTERASRVLDAAVIGLGVAELATSALGLQSRRRTPSLIPLALASAGLLGLVVTHRENVAEREQQRLEKRARIVERLVPQRRARLDRIVVHV
jgi:hypothetical protein